MTFYHRTLCHSTGITHAVLGHFLSEKKEDIIVSTGRILKLLRFEPSNKVIQTLISDDTYGVICSLAKFRRNGETKDWVVFSTDSGNVTILAADSEKMSFELVLEKDFTKIPRTLSIQDSSSDSQGHEASIESKFQDMFKEILRKYPGHFLAANSQDFLFIAAVEFLKQLWFFPDPDDNKLLEILDASEEKVLIFDVAFVEINSENLVIAYLATPYKELHAGSRYEIKERQKPSLVFLEKNENKLIEIKRIKCLNYANSLISVPGEKGVLVCAEDSIAFYSVDSSDIIRCSIPKRIMDPKTGIIFVCSTKYSEKADPNLKHESTKGDTGSVSFPKSNVKNSVYYFAQTEQGDIFKIQLVINEFGVNEIILKYFITLPVASALCTSESGFLFVASEFGDHHIYKIADIENRARCQPSFSSSLALPKGKPFFFLHRTVDIVPLATIKSMSPIMQMEFASLSSNGPQMCLATGRASLSAFKISAPQPDVSYQFCAEINKEQDELPLRMWAIESTKSISEKPKTLIVISFENSTAVYSLEKAPEYVMEKMKGTLFATNISTICCAKTGKDAIVQICPEGICLITDGENKLIHKTEEKDAVQNCAMNKKALIVAFGNKELKHHEIGENGHLKTPKIPRRLLNGPVTCMLLSDKSASDQLLAVGISIPASPKTPSSVGEVQLYVVTASEIKVLCMLKVENYPHSFLFMNLQSNLDTILVGCENGKLLTLSIKETTEESIEEASGKTEHINNFQLMTMKIERIGSKAVQLLYVPVLGDILAVSNHSWFKRTAGGDFIQLKSDLTPCICILPESHGIQKEIATIMENSFWIFVIEDLPPPLTIPLEFTPKKFAIDSCSKQVFLIEADDNSYTEGTREKKQDVFKQHVAAAQSKQPAPKPPAVENIPRSWASIFRVIDLSEKSAKVLKLPLNQNEAALSFCHFKVGNGNIFLVGVAKDFNQSTACCTEASIHTYKMQNKTPIRFLHKTLIKSAPLAMCYYEGDVLIGIGRKLALYCLAEESFKLELQCEKKECVSNSITAIYPLEDRILVSDSKFGISCLIHDSSDNCLHLVDKDIGSAELTTASILNDYQMARATLSRDIFIVKLGDMNKRDMSRVYKENEIPFTLSEEKLLACFHVGEVVTSMQQFRTFPKDPNALVYTTLSGSIGILSLLPSEKDAEFLKSLNMALLKTVKKIDKNRPNLKLSHHFQFRSRHYRSENVIDGDFLDQFRNLKVDLQMIVAKEMEEEDISKISSKLENIRRETMLDFKF